MGKKTPTKHTGRLNLSTSGKPSGGNGNNRLSLGNCPNMGD